MPTVKQAFVSIFAPIFTVPMNLFARFTALLRSSLFGLCLFVLLIIAVVIVGLAINGTFHNLYQTTIMRMHKLLADTGFALEDVTVEGRHYTDRQTLLDVLNLTHDMPIFTIDLAMAKQRLESLVWVEKATVYRILPNLLHITLTERQPFALWKQQTDKGTTTLLIDRHGTPITSEKLHLYAHLPIFKGAESQHHAAALIETLTAYPSLQKRVIEAERFSDRRWTLYLDHGGTIHLPAENVTQALDLLMDMDSKKQILALRGQSIDLRVPNRVFLRAVPLPDAKTDKPKGENT